MLLFDGALQQYWFFATVWFFIGSACIRRANAASDFETIPAFDYFLGRAADIFDPATAVPPLVPLAALHPIRPASLKRPSVIRSTTVAATSITLVVLLLLNVVPFRRREAYSSAAMCVTLVWLGFPTTICKYIAVSGNPSALPNRELNDTDPFGEAEDPIRLRRVTGRPAFDDGSTRRFYAGGFTLNTALGVAVALAAGLFAHRSSKQKTANPLPR